MAESGESTVVCVLGELAPAAGRELVSHTPLNATVLLEDGAEGLPGRPAGRHRGVADALRQGEPSDMAFVSGAAFVSPGWLDRLQAAARADTTVASAAALEIREPEQLEDVAADLARRSLRLRPRIVPVPALCVLALGRPLTLVEHGALPNDPQAALVELLQRLVLQGFQHVVADDVVVAGPPHIPGEAEGELLRERRPWASCAAEEPDSGGSPAASGVNLALGLARRGLEVSIDLRALGAGRSGAELHMMELVAALARGRKARLRLVVSDGLSKEARTRLEGFENARVATPAELHGDGSRTGVVHRPMQVAVTRDVEVLQTLGERLVVTQQDLIAYRNPGYHASPAMWLQYRRATRQGLAMADAVVFSSRHAFADAQADALVEASRTHVLPISAPAPTPPPTEPPPERLLAAGLGERPFLLCLGNDFRHKNRVFALRLLVSLRKLGWAGRLALAGAHMPYGSSQLDEQRLLAEGELERDVVDLLGVSSEERDWLYGRAAAILYPSHYEGFGLVPFEAGLAGVPCLFASQSALEERLPTEAAVLVPWEAGESARRALPLLTPSVEREAHVHMLRSAAEALPSWDDHAGALLEIYERVAVMPEREARLVARQALEAERELAGWNEMRVALGDEGFGLVRPGGYLPPEIQRALLSIVTRPRLRAPFFAALRALHSSGHRLRR